MKKTIIKCLLSILILLSGVASPNTIFADDSHTHTVPGYPAFVFTEWNSSTSLPTDFGSYYLTQDITLSDDAIVNETIYICLNGHVVNLNENHIVVNKGIRLGIFDCQETVHEGYVDATGLWHLSEVGHPTDGETSKTINGGIITGGNGNNGGCIEIKSDAGSIGQVFLLGGTLAGNSATNNGGAIYNNGYFEMQGGSIVNNDAECGGAIYNNKAANVKYNSKELSDNVAVNGGAVYNDVQGELLIKSLTIKNNIASGKGGAVYNNGYLEIISDTFNGNEAAYGGAIYNCSNSRAEITSSSITGCTASDNGGAIYNEVHSGDDLKTVVIGGNVSITGCEATNNGGAIYNLGSFGLENVSITNNKVTSSSGKGGGIYQGGSLFVGDTLKVISNKVDNTINNVFLCDGKFVTVGSGYDVKVPAEGMQVGITMANPGVFTSNIASDYANYFLSDDAAYRVKHNSDNKLQLVSSTIVINEDTSENYASLAVAISEVGNGQTLKLLDDNSETIEVSKEIEFIINKNSFNNNATITAGSGYKLSKSGEDEITYKFTKKIDPVSPDRSYKIPNTGIDKA